ncbi:cyclase/dehydrase [Mycobacterium senegalense]|nr:cyclase/dehydrase [Mycolicibacterium senegalense]
MATSDSREVVIEATPQEILDVVADVEATPSWSPQYQRAEILESYDDGRPKQVKMTVKAAG